MGSCVHRTFYFEGNTCPFQLPSLHIFALLCIGARNENIYFLKLPWKARDKNIELWFAGGNNIEKLNHLPKRNEPIYYSCDWDFDGLTIYQRVKEYIPDIKLLYPSSASSAKPVDTSNHSSQWRPGHQLSGLDETIYSKQELRLLQTLILANEWIEEETSDFDALVQLNCILRSV